MTSAQEHSDALSYRTWASSLLPFELCDDITRRLAALELIAGDKPEPTQLAIDIASAVRIGLVAALDELVSRAASADPASAPAPLAPQTALGGMIAPELHP